MSLLRGLVVLHAVGLAAPAWAQVTPDDLRPFEGAVVVVATTTATFRGFLVGGTGTASGTATFVRCSPNGGLFIANIPTTVILDFEPGVSRPR
jgi:hypothetical protein